MQGLVIATSLSTLATVSYSVVAVVLAILGALFLRAHLRHLGFKAQLVAKDDAIRTNEQTIEALEKRLGTLEHDFRSMLAINEKLRVEVTALKDELSANLRGYAELERVSGYYSAPQAVERFEKLLITRLADFDRVEGSLRRIEEKCMNIHAAVGPGA